MSPPKKQYQSRGGNLISVYIYLYICERSRYCEPQNCTTLGCHLAPQILVQHHLALVVLANIDIFLIHPERRMVFSSGFLCGDMPIL